MTSSSRPPTDAELRANPRSVSYVPPAPARLDLLSILVVTVLALVGIVVLAVLQLAIPDVLPLVVTAGVGALGMAARPLVSPTAKAGR